MEEKPKRHDWNAGIQPQPAIAPPPQIGLVMKRSAVAQKKESMEALHHAAGWIRHELGQRIRMKFLPECGRYV